MVTWKKVEERFGKELADKMKESTYMHGVTCRLRKDKMLDFYWCDIEKAYRDVCGESMDSEDWD